ncbi:O-antigen ligase [Elusimicrobium posterum]|uniref:O-antigen ligase family protein n=1 Tax=Elusimicrobium posterum TaxID=3116653 RepID=UPI003C792C61
MKDKFIFNAKKIFLALAFFAAPLVFFTNTTPNPWAVQILISCFAFSALALLITIGKVKFNKADLFFFLFCAFCFISWAASLLVFRGYNAVPLYNLAGVGIVLFVWMSAYFCGRNTELGDEKEAYNLTFFLLVPLWCAFWFLYPKLGVVYGVILWCAGLFLAYKILYKIEFDNLAHLILAAAFAASSYGLVQAVGFDFLLPANFNQGFVATFGNPNFLASALCALIPLVIYYFIYARGWRKIIYILLFCIFTLFVFVSGARSAWGAGLIGLVLFAAYPVAIKEFFTLKNLKFVLIIPLFFASFYFTAGSNYQKYSAPKITEMVDYAQGKDKYVQSITQRRMLWQAALSITKEHPALGVGWGNFQQAYAIEQGKIIKHSPQLNVFRTQGNSAHNFIFQLLAEIGVPGVILLTIFISLLAFGVSAFIKENHSKKAVLAVALLSGGAAFLADNLLNITLFIVVPASIFWFIAGALNNFRSSIEINITKIGLVLGTLVFIIITVVNVKIFASQVLLWQGQRLMAQQMYLAAQPKFEKALAVYSGNFEAAFALGHVHIKKNENEKAYEYFHTGTKINPAYDEMFFNAAVTAYAYGNKDAFARNITSALNLNPQNPTARVLLNTFCSTDAQTEKEKYRQYCTF